MVTLLYHKKLDAAWTSAAQQLRAALARDCPSFRVPSSSPSQPAANGHAATAHAARPAPAAASQAASSEQPSGSSQPAANGHAAPAEPVPQAAAAASAAADGLADPSTAGSTSQGAALAAEAVTTDKPAADAASRDGVQQHPVPPDRVTDSTAAPEQPSPAAAVSRDAEAGGEQAELLDDAPLPGLLGRARKQRIVLGRDHVTELMPVGERTLTYRYSPCFHPTALIRAQALGGTCTAHAAVNESLAHRSCARVLLAHFATPEPVTSDDVSRASCSWMGPSACPAVQPRAALIPSHGCSSSCWSCCPVAVHAHLLLPRSCQASLRAVCMSQAAGGGLQPAQWCRVRPHAALGRAGHAWLQR